MREEYWQKKRSVVLFNHGKGIPNLKGETKMNTYNLNIEYLTTTLVDDDLVFETEIFPLHVNANSYEAARAKALEIAQGMSRAFNGTGMAMYFRIIVD